jgi:cysteine-rich repeat protein
MQHGTMSRFVFATLLVALGMSSPATAVDLSGDYVAPRGVFVWSLPGITAFTVTAVQTGTTVQLTGDVVFEDALSPRPHPPFISSITHPLSAAGTVDPDTGTFSVTGEITGLCPDFVYNGTGDGEELDGTLTSRTCPSAPVLLTKCGNGVIDPMENCEDGNHLDGDCCSARCRLASPGTACTSDGNECTNDVCDATGVCMHVPNTGPCDDGNACTTGDVCTGGACLPGSPAPAGEPCEDDFDPCTADVCAAAGTCTHVPVSPAECRRAVACHSTCTEQLKECRHTCPARGQARRECRAACAERSTCTAPGASIRTLAYVMTECTTDRQGRSTLNQKLLVRRGNCDPITVPEVDAGLPQSDPSGLCRQFGAARHGTAATALGLFRRLAVLPDGSGVVYEMTAMTSRFRILRRPPQEGFFFVRADGRAHHWLGPPSRVEGTEAARMGTDFFPVSPDGRSIALTDLGPDAAGRDAPQIFRFDPRSGQRRQLTDHSQRICCAGFLNNATIFFHLPPGGPIFTVATNGQRREKALPVIMLPGGGRVVSRFEVSGVHPTPLYVFFPSRLNVYGSDGVVEVFLLDGQNPLQVTNLGRYDTDDVGAFVTRGQVLFSASANLGENPAEICQLFSVDTEGSHLRQVTHLPWDGREIFPGQKGLPCLRRLTDVRATCGLSRVFHDPVSGTVLFQSSCDPVGQNPFGDQVFAMRLNGTGLRQLTSARGMTTDPDGTLHVELPGPVASAFRAGG